MMEIYYIAGTIDEGSGAESFILNNRAFHTHEEAECYLQKHIERFNAPDYYKDYGYQDGIDMLPSYMREAVNKFVNKVTYKSGYIEATLFDAFLTFRVDKLMSMTEE